MLQDIVDRMKNTINLTYKLNFKMNNKYGEELNNVNLVDSYMNVYKLTDKVASSEKMGELNVIDGYRLDSSIEHYSAMIGISKGSFEKVENGKEIKAYKVNSNGKELMVELKDGDIPVINTSNKKFYYQNGKPMATFFKKTGVYANYTNSDVIYTKYDEINDTHSNISYQTENPSGIHRNQYGVDELLNDKEVMSIVEEKYPRSSFSNKLNANTFYENYLSKINTQKHEETYNNVNQILNNYTGKEESFKLKYGFDSYTVDREGNINFNDKLLVVKEYCDKN